MQPDSHPGTTESHNNAGGAPQVTAASGSQSVRSSVAVFVGIFGLAALPLVSCTDEDSTGVIARGGSSGSSGSAGTGGSAGSAGLGGSGGTAGTAGAAGAGGAAGSGGDPFDGAAVAAAICATQAQLAGSAPSDAGTDAAAPDGGDGGPAAVEGCAPSATCVDEYVGIFGFYESEVAACVDEMQAYFGCMATQPVSAYVCVEGIPGFNIGNHGCVAEETAFNEGVINNCAD